MSYFYPYMPFAVADTKQEPPSPWWFVVVIALYVAVLATAALMS